MCNIKCWFSFSFLNIYLFRSYTLYMYVLRINPSPSCISFPQCIKCAKYKVNAALWSGWSLLLFQFLLYRDTLIFLKQVWKKKTGRKLKNFKFLNSFCLKGKNVMKLHSPSIKQNILSVNKMIALFALETYSLFAYFFSCYSCSAWKHL